MTNTANNGTVSKVTTYGVPGPSRSRASSFEVGGFTVLVSGGDGDEGTEAARKLAQGLANGAEVAASQRDEIDRLRAELAKARAQIPPTRPSQIMCRGYVRADVSGALWLLSKRETGWAAFGYCFRDWDELFRRWNVRVVETGADEHGPFVAVENCEAR